MNRSYFIILFFFVISNSNAQEPPLSFTDGSTIAFPSSRCYVLVDKATATILSIFDRTKPEFVNIELQSEVCNDRILFYDKANLKYGYLGIDGEVKIKATFKEARPFSSGRAAVLSRAPSGLTTWRFIDTEGNFISPLGFNEVNDFIGNYAIVSDTISKKYGILRGDGVLTVPMVYDKLSAIGEEAVSFYDSKTRLSGYISTSNKLLIKPQFHETGAFSDSIAFVKNDITKELGFIDISGKFVLKLIYSIYYATLSEGQGSYPRFSDGLCAMYDSTEGKWGYINEKGEWVIDPIYFRASHFNNGIADVAINNVEVGCYIDTHGDIIRIDDERLSAYIFYNRMERSIIFGDGKILATCYANSIVSRLVYGRYSTIYGLQPKVIIIDYNPDI